VEDQAIDRVHRLGQTAESVTVLRLVVQDSVEQQMLEIQVCAQHHTRWSLPWLPTGVPPAIMQGLFSVGHCITLPVMCLRLPVRPRLTLRAQFKRMFFRRRSRRWRAMLWPWLLTGGRRRRAGSTSTSSGASSHEASTSCWWWVRSG
jgi:hypothetical protein